MKALVSGIVDLSTIDYPKKASAVIFLYGCNMKCPYCHNLKFMLEHKRGMTVEEIFNDIDFLFADAIVISGGEPTLQKDAVIEIARYAKEKGFPVKIDTNGTHPEVIEELIKNKLIDYVAIDVKCRFDKYKEFVKCREDGEEIKNKILKIIDLCKKNNVFVECRTTFVPKVMDEEDIEDIAKTVKDCDLYAIQQFEPKDAYDEEFKKLPMPKENELRELGKIAKKYIDNVVIRTINGTFEI
ncbi:TPA: anaerobic ribonucleoside-triphosphate reductase activating protein [Methanocaldococcus jannaschii]|uniref:Putative glycyl-radical enzyme activating enzyme MJ1227 n=2 Tax=Methanocaldococcus jannaschii TaxID=2190 RepID=Y1227_METJA|nr:anaerobic ribonucleoside-triphosphate reductase activating protein [Methanocaldococcus jannaschii]Q58624.1 RecName: Full=Putative glycyl-radical enzyme activating enzyme MJ1227; Short=GRE activating enzyme MJ1227 [Methanocaldococcus jannaschii DSM 2661]AAB99230.1 pyruvate formate-lyase activating enzyme (act) [Methanocaldococcus jannaschii DSM 2661]HII59986.1 anaerobic ribonucleoside-triphosphate reductase activating protein [Methanocaldococcus jannaschii]